MSCFKTGSILFKDARSIICSCCSNRMFFTKKRVMYRRSSSIYGNDSNDNNLPIIIPTKRVPIHLYTEEIESEAINQLVSLAESPMPVDYVCAMPDAHLGKGVTVGSVFASEDYICPNAVGVDIGCGMAAVPIQNLYKWDLSHRDMVLIQQKIKERIPTGFSSYKIAPKNLSKVVDDISQKMKHTKHLSSQLHLPRVVNQLGTLGGGNHFLEVLFEEKSGQIWVMVHSGSRNIGNRIAMYYDALAKKKLRTKRNQYESIERYKLLTY